MLARSGVPRPGITLLELIVTLVIAGIALALVAAISARQQRVVGDLQENVALSAQLGDALSILPIDLSAVSSVAGDVREARDTSLEIRATIATSVGCDTSGGRLVLSPPSDGAVVYAGILSAIEAGDTAADSTSGSTVACAGTPAICQTAVFEAGTMTVTVTRGGKRKPPRFMSPW